MVQVNFSPVFLATRQDEEPARLVFADERIVAILVPIRSEDDRTAEGWYLEVGFGPCDAEGLLFPSLRAAEAWVREQLGDRSGARQAAPQGGEPLDARQERSRDGSRGPSRPLRILIVEDDGLQALELEDHLHRLGHEVIGMVASGPAAVAAAEKHRPDLVLMDVRLANGTNGIDAAAEIRQRLGILSIFMTAHSDAQTQARIEQVRSLDLLAKPVSSAAVGAALQRAALLAPLSARPS